MGTDRTRRHPAPRPLRATAPPSSAPACGRAESSHPPPDGDGLRRERDEIRAVLVDARPELAARIEEGPSGAVVIPVDRERRVEIGRMRRRGGAQWVVVWTEGGRARLREASGARAIARTALAALDRRAVGSASAQAT